jgi:3-phosphoshikimate 1-carboxyvinyltransferase
VSAELSDAPDLFPVLAAVAASLPPGSRISGIERLRHKESDRVSAMVENLRGLGARVEVAGPELRVMAPVEQKAGEARRVTAAGDHRIAMAMAVALHRSSARRRATSRSGFWEVWRTVAGRPP